MSVLQLSPELVLDLADHVRLGMLERPRTERMGQLFGHRRRSIYTILGYSPYKGGIRRSEYVEYEPVKFLEKAEQLEKRSGMDYLGMYHSHPLRYNERIPGDLEYSADQSEVDRAIFKENRWNSLSLIVAVGRGRQAAKRFSVAANKTWFIRRPRGHLQLICTEACRLIWVIQGRLSWFFLFRGYTHDRKGDPRALTFDVTFQLDYRGLLTFR